MKTKKIDFQITWSRRAHNPGIDGIDAPRFADVAHGHVYILPDVAYEVRLRV